MSAFLETFEFCSHYFCSISNIISCEIGDFTCTSRPNAVPTQLFIHQLSAALFPRRILARCVVEFKNVWNCTSSHPVCLHGLVLSEFCLYLLILQFSFFGVYHEISR
jgi:hypothetical protein